MSLVYSTPTARVSLTNESMSEEIYSGGIRCSLENDVVDVFSDKEGDIVMAFIVDKMMRNIGTLASLRIDPPR